MKHFKYAVSLLLAVAILISLLPAVSVRANAVSNATVEVTDVTSGGSVNLTEAGTTDWIHPVYADGWKSQLVHKAGGGHIIGFEATGGYSLSGTFTDSPVKYAWSDGEELEKPRWDSEATWGGIINCGNSAGEVTDEGDWRITLPADDSIQTLTIISGLCAASTNVRILADGEEIYAKERTADGTAQHYQYTITAMPGTKIEFIGKMTNKTQGWGNMTLGCAYLTREQVVKMSSVVSVTDVTAGEDCNLTELGSRDWLHPAYSDGWKPQLVHKNNVDNVITFETTGEHIMKSLFTDSPVTYHWTDGKEVEQDRWDNWEIKHGGVISCAGDTTGTLGDKGSYRISVPAAEKVQKLTIISGLCESSVTVQITVGGKTLYDGTWTASSAVHKKYTIIAAPGESIEFTGKIIKKTISWGNATFGAAYLSWPEVEEGADYIELLRKTVSEAQDFITEKGDDIAAAALNQLEQAIRAAQSALSRSDLTQDEALLQYLVLSEALTNARNAGTDKQYANKYATGNVCAFGWEGDKDAPLCWPDGTYKLRNNGNQYVTFGVDSLPAKSVDWYNAEGYLPCFVSEYEKDGLKHKIENFADEVYVDGNRYEVVYSRMTTVNVSDSEKRLPKVSDNLISLTETTSQTHLAAGATVVRDYCIGADRFGASYDFPSDDALAAQGDWDTHYQHMKDYWNGRLKNVVKIESVPEEYADLINAYKAGYIYTLIISDGDQLHVGEGKLPEGGYDDYVWDHDAIGILAALIESGHTDNFEKYASNILANVTYPDGAWKFSWPFALYLEKTGDWETVVKYFENVGSLDGIKTNTHKIAAARAVYDESIKDADGNTARIMGKTYAIDSHGLWTIDNWAALFGLTTYSWVCEKLAQYDSANASKYLSERQWAQEEYASLIKSVEAVLTNTMEKYGFDYIPISMVMPNEQTERKNLRDGNWAAQYLFGRWNWDGYLFGAPQDSKLLKMTDQTYDYIIEQKSSVLPSPYTMGGYPGYCSAYNAGYYSAALSGEKWRDAGIKAYQWMIDNAMSSPFGWWESVYDTAEDSPWKHKTSYGMGSSQHMWGQSVATKVLIDSFLAEKSDGTIIAGRGLPAEWITDGQEIKISNWLCNGGKHIGFTLNAAADYIDFTLTGDTLTNDVSLELLALKDNIKSAGSCEFDSEAGTVCIPAGTRSVRIYLGQAVEVASVTLDKSEMELKIGETGKLTATVSPAEASKKLAWTSSDASVASVDANGNVSAVNEGTAIITVTAVGGKTASCTVTVKPSTEEMFWKLTSPDEMVRVNVRLAGNGTLHYNATRAADFDEDGNVTASKSIVGDSLLGIQTDLADLSKGLTFVKAETREINENYTMVSGKQKENTNHCTELTLTFQKGEAELTVILRAYDDGYAFRYRVAKTDGTEGKLTVTGEKGTFNLPAGSEVFAMRNKNLTDIVPSQNNRLDFWFEHEGTFKQQKVEQVSGQQSMPMLSQSPDGVWTLITEAGIYGDEYVGSFLERKDGTQFEVVIPFQQKYWGPKTTTVQTEYPFTSPWRIAIAGDLGDIVESNLVHHVSDASELEDTSWIEPGVAAWTWIFGRNAMQSDPDAIKRYIDFAAEMGWKYFIMDDGWQPRNPNFPTDRDTQYNHDMPADERRNDGYYEWFDDVLAYAKEKGIGLIAWVLAHDLDTPQKREVLKEWSEKGIVGIKVDFFDSDDQDTIGLYREIYEACAENHLIVNAHGANKPTGEARTWPNVINREAVRGEEWGGYSTVQTTIWPFTRGVVGPMDVTPRIYSNGTTTGQQAAMYIIYESGMPCMASSIEDYQSSPALSLLRNLPAAWDEIHFIDGYPGQFATLARRSGDTWYAASINSSNARDAQFPLAFLEDGTTYCAVIYRDGKTSKDMIVEAQKVTSEDTLTIPMSANGGCSVKLIPLGEETVESIELPSSFAVEKGKTLDLTCKIQPAKFQDSDLLWTVEDPSVASVSGSTLTGLKIGETTVTVTSMRNPLVKATTKLIVTGEQSVPGDGWTIINPSSSADDQTVLYDNPNKITLKTLFGDVEALENEAKNVWLYDAPEGDFSITVKIGGAGFSENYQKAGLVVWHDNATVASVVRRYHSNLAAQHNGNPNLFTMFQKLNGRYSEPGVEDTDPTKEAWLKLEKKGNEFIGYYSWDNESWTEVGRVTNAKVAGSDQMKIGVYAVTGSINAKVKSVDFENFTCSAIRNGEIIPFAKKSVVTAPVTSVELDKSELAMTIGETAELTATVIPTGAENRNVSWKSSDESVATVDENGSVTAIREGTAIITVTTEDGGFTADCTVTVRAKADKSALEALYNELKDTTNDGYTGETWEAFEEALNEAKQTLDNENATQGEVDAATETLRNAAAALAKPEIKPADKSALEKLVKEAEALKSSDYTKKSFRAVEKALKAAKKVLADETLTEADQKKVDDAAAALQEAMNALVKAEGKTPTTGDSVIVLSGMIFVLSAAAIALLIVLAKKRRAC